MTNVRGLFIIAIMRTVQRTPGVVSPALRRDGTLLGVTVALPGVSFGALGIAAGLPWWAPVVMSVAVFAGGSQFAALGVLASGAGAAPAVVTGLLLNLRLVPYGLTMADTVVPGAAVDVHRAATRRRIAQRWALPHLLVDESVGLAQTRSDPRERRTAFLLGGWAVFVGWNLGVLAGVAVGQSLGDPTRWGLDAAMPAVLAALVVGAVRTRRPDIDTGPAEPTTPPVRVRDRLDRRLLLAALAGGAIGIAAAGVLPPGLDMLAALTGGLVVLIPGRRPTGPADVVTGRS